MSGNGFDSLFPCNNCGWCCKRTPCSLGVYLGTPLKGPCQFLQETEEGKFFCGLVAKEIDEVKKMAVKELILSGTGCTHKFGPHPVSLLKALLGMGLVVGSEDWNHAKRETRKELLKFSGESERPEDLHEALAEFEAFCQGMELG